MKSRNKLILALGILVVVSVAREQGIFDFSIARTNSTHTASAYFSNGTRPERAYNPVTVTVAEPGGAEPAFHADPAGAVSWTVVLDEPEFGGLSWLPLYKRMSYRIAVRAGNLEGITVDGQAVSGKPEDGAPHGFVYKIEGVVTALGLQTRRGLREAVIQSAMDDAREDLTEYLRELEPEEASTSSNATSEDPVEVESSAR